MQMNDKLNKKKQCLSETPHYIKIFRHAESRLTQRFKVSLDFGPLCSAGLRCCNREGHNI